MRKLLYFSKINYFSSHYLWFCWILPVFSLKVKQTISWLVLLQTFSPFPSLYRGCHISRAKMEDRAKWPHFTDQLPRPASYHRLRGRREPFSAVQVNYHIKRSIPHEPQLAIYLHCALHPHHMVKIHRLLIACESSLLLPRKSKMALIVLIAIDLLKNNVSGHKCSREITHHPAKRQASKSYCLIEHPFLIEKSLSIFSLSCDVELESGACYCGWWICQLLWYEWG